MERWESRPLGSGQTGGKDQSARSTLCLTCDVTLSASSASAQTMLKQPTRSPYSPMFLANDWHTSGRTPSETIFRT